MSDKIGNVSYYDSTGRSEMGFTKPYSEKTAEEIDLEVKKLIDQAYATANRVLTEHREGFEALAALLLEREVIFSEDVERILGPRKGGVNPNALLQEEPEKPQELPSDTSEPEDEPIEFARESAEDAPASEAGSESEAEKPSKPRRRPQKKAEETEDNAGDTPTLF